MIDAKTINDALEMVFIKADDIETIRHGDMLRTYQAAVIIAFSMADPWQAFFMPSQLPRQRWKPWVVKNKVTGSFYEVGVTGRPYRYEGRANAEAVAARINRTGS